MRKLVAPLALLILIFTVFRSWFSLGLLSSFDFPFYSDVMIKNATFSIFAWDFHVGLDGFSRFTSPYSWIFPVLNFFQVIFGKLGLNWALIERITYFYPLLILLIISPIILGKYLFPKNNFYFISILIFSFNTYSLLLFSSQIFLALAYSLMPIVFVLFIHLFSVRNKKGRSKYKYVIFLGLVFALQVLIETRVAFVTIVSIVLYLLLYCLFNIKSFSKSNVKQYIYDFIFVFLIPLIITILIHAFWILPTIFYGKNPVSELGISYSAPEAVKYLSFARFENTISLLHPNWPENIFGKVYFLRLEFLILPVLAFIGLFFIKNLKKNNERFYIIYFLLLGLLGVFLAKGSNEPFGFIYLWLFNNIPGFELFRDSSKWFPLVCLSYMILIPFSIWKIYEFLKRYEKINLKDIFLVIIIIYLVYLIKPAIFGEIGGTFKKTNIPVEYERLETFLVNQPKYFRTLWFPQRQRFAYYSNRHPLISARALFNIFDNKKLLSLISKGESRNLLKESSIKYIIIPYDSEGEIFLDDRKYNEEEYLKTVKEIETINWLKPVGDFGKIKVFELDNPRNHFWMIGDKEISYKYISPVEYKVELEDIKRGDVLIFSESFDNKWSFIFNDSKIMSDKYSLFNSFKLNKSGTYSATVYYEPQKYVNIGLVISGFTLASIIFLLGFGYVTKKW